MASILRHKEPKGDHYNSQLTHALLKGNWADATAGNAPNGTALSWSELFRKWGKHTGGNTSLLHHLRDISLLYLSSRSMASSTYINLATDPNTPQTAQANASAPGSSSSNEGTTTTSASNSSFVHVPHPQRQKGRTSEINPTASSSRGTSVVRQPDGRASFLSTGDLDGDDVHDNGPWSENGTWWTAVASENVEEVKEGIQAIEKSIKEDKLSAGELASAKAILVYHHFSIGEHVQAIRIAEELETIQDVRTGIVHGDIGVLDRIRTRCLKGMSIELSGGDGHTAIQVYLSTLPLLDSFESLTRPTPSYISQDPSPSKGKFDSHQEVYRYLSTALSRAAVLSARTTDVTRTLRILRTYHSFSSSWSHTFRPVQRQRLLLLYLRALQAGYPAPNTACATPYLVDIGSSQAPGRQVWKKEVLEAFKQGQQLLSSTTTFPRAGTLNLPVRRFTESCVALADIHSPFAKEVVAILYWAMTLTFQSQSLLRHLTRLLAVSGSYADAKRNFELYVKIVLKDRETKQPEISLQLKRRPTVGEAAHPDEIARQAQEAEDESGPEAEEKKSQFAEAESDTTAEFISTLLVGSRLLVKNLGEVEEAWRYAGLAGKMISVTDQRKEHVPRDLRAEVEACKGIVRMALAMSSEMPDVDASNRAEYQSQAIDLLTTATLLSPKSSKAQYHLAYCLAEARQIEPAISAIRTCLELDQQNVQAWHLLALLLSASKDWEGSTKACEAGIRIWEDDEENDAAESEESPTGNPDENEPTVGTKDFASPNPTVTHPTETISAAPIILRSGAIRSPAPLSPAPPTRSKKLENVIRLRITYKTIIEKTQGAEPAMEEAENLFAFFSERSGSGRSNFGYRRGLSGVMNQSMISVKDTGGSYVSVADLQNAMLENPGHRTSMLSIQAPEGDGGASEELSELQLSNTTSPDDMTAQPEGDTNEKEKEIRNEKAGSVGHQSLHRKMLASHLHIPGSRQGSLASPNSGRRLGTGAASTPDLSLPRDRTMSIGSYATPSLAPTHAATLANTYAPSRPTSPPLPGSDHGRTPTESRILSGLWLQSAATYRRWGKVDQCLVSIQEAEIIDPENPDVWVQLGLLHRTTSPHSPHLAIAAFTKSVLLRPDYTPSIVLLSKVYLKTGQLELAHNMLFQLTQGGGWDVPEAWYYLGKACEEQGRRERARACFEYALELESTRPCRTWAEAVDRWL